MHESINKLGYGNEATFWSYLSDDSCRPNGQVLNIPLLNVPVGGVAFYDDEKRNQTYGGGSVTSVILGAAITLNWLPEPTLANIVKCLSFRGDLYEHVTPFLRTIRYRVARGATHPNDIFLYQYEDQSNEDGGHIPSYKLDPVELRTADMDPVGVSMIQLLLTRVFGMESPDKELVKDALQVMFSSRGVTSQYKDAGSPTWNMELIALASEELQSHLEAIRYCNYYCDVHRGMAREIYEKRFQRALKRHDGWIIYAVNDEAELVALAKQDVAAFKLLADCLGGAYFSYNSSNTCIEFKYGRHWCREMLTTPVHEVVQRFLEGYLALINQSM